MAIVSKSKDLSMKNLMAALNDVPEWEELGIELGIEWFKMKEIKKNRNHCEPRLCKADLLDHWLENDLQASWERLASALDNMGKKVVAQRIRATYCCN